uniref:Uncharacterized protein n=1 Tax=viral metagenome TaxID=1070528 RepID=A0A6C0C842_9ZZZZ
MSLRKIIFVENLHIAFNRSSNVERNVVAKDYICCRFARHIQWIVKCQMQCCCKGLYLLKICMSHSIDRRKLNAKELYLRKNAFHIQ